MAKRGPKPKNYQAQPLEESISHEEQLNNEDNEGEVEQSFIPEIKPVQPEVFKSSFRFKSGVTHGRGNQRLVFQKGDVVGDLSESEIKTFLVQGLIEKI
jgi:hypothetical protein